MANVQKRGPAPNIREKVGSRAACGCAMGENIGQRHRNIERGRPWHRHGDGAVPLLSQGFTQTTSTPAHRLPRKKSLSPKYFSSPAIIPRLCLVNIREEANSKVEFPKVKDTIPKSTLTLLPEHAVVRLLGIECQFLVAS